MNAEPVATTSQTGVVARKTPVRRASLLFGSRRIAARIFIGYLLPLIIALVAGVALPILFSTILGKAVRDNVQTATFVDDAYALRRAARDSENDLRGYLLYNDAEYRTQFAADRDDYRKRFGKMRDFVARQNTPSLEGQLNLADSAYRKWYGRFATPEFAAADRALAPRDLAVGRSAALRSANGYRTVSTAMNRLTGAAERYARQQRSRANLSERLRVAFTWVVPLVAIIIAVIFARFFTEGITRPIEELRRAAEEVERGDTTRLLLDEFPDSDDEIGDLANALSRMAQTIGEREAILRAQNEALAAIGRRIEAVLNATNDGIVLLDRAEGFSLVNERFAALFGIVAEDVRDQTFTDAAPLFLDRFKNKSTAQAQFRAWVADWEAVADETLDVSEPTPRTLRIYTAPVRGEAATGEKGGIIGRIFVFRDVTRETIVDRMKTEFVSTVSHELRTPLTAIKGYVDLMMSGKTGDLSPVQTEFLGMVQESTRRLTNLINDMLDISRIESGRISVRRETVDILPLVREALRMMQGQAEAKGLSLTLLTPDDSLPPVRGDRDRITQVLVNLLSNAVKYTPSGGSVSVSLEEESGILTVCIADTGIGINADDQNRLFQKFFRADNSTTREVGGTGLGLAITKAILERMAGTIRAESEPGNGSRFYFTLPAAPMPLDAPEKPVVTMPPPPPTLVMPGAVASRALILLAEDDTAIMHRLTGLFRGLGYITSGAMTLGEGLRRARDLRPDAVLVNVAATKLNVLALLYTLRSHAETRRLPLFLCALNDADGEIESYPSVMVMPANEPPAEESLTIGQDDSPETLAHRLVEAQAGSDDPVAVAVDLADFAPGNGRIEALALALQGLVICGKPIVLHIRDVGGDTADAGEPMVSLASPDLPHSSLGAIAEAIGNRLRRA